MFFKQTKIPLIFTQFWNLERFVRNPLVGQWLRLRAFNAGAQVQPLVGELIYQKPHRTAKKKKKLEKSLKITYKPQSYTQQVNNNPQENELSRENLI